MADSPHLCAEDLGPDPIEQFHAWFAAAHDAGIEHPEAAAVASATPEGRPSCRMVLVKAVDERGFVFFTNYQSRKGEELIANPYAALLFHWEAQERQVRVEGPVAQTSRDRSILYARTRSRQSQLSALASAQSRPVESREVLEARVAELDAAYPEGTLPVSEHWGGFRIQPERMEFWQGGVARLHDRFVYARAGDGWAITRLQP
ncbi:MAG TPA: pyridoxamine 5'-phosphate oxidase [Solirubrobacteraceae bacterium]|nr:pyridoxamine 5'-phosphate oxidase [Solirubrobacteraceae bacterium]